MKQKWKKLAACCFALAMGIFVFSYVLYHHMTPEGVFTMVSQQQPGKPMVTWLFAIWGVMFLFASVISLLIGHVFYDEK